MNWKIHRALLIAAIWIAEVLAAGICGFIAALALVPASYAARGYYAFGGEWLIVSPCWRSTSSTTHFSRCSRTTERR